MQETDGGAAEVEKIVDRSVTGDQELVASINFMQY